MDGFPSSLYCSLQDVETNNNKYNKTQSQTPTTEAPKPASVDVEGTWQAVDFRDTLEKVFLLQYDDAASRLKATEALKDVVPVLKVQGNKVTFEYTANMSKFLDAYGECDWQKTI